MLTNFSYIALLLIAAVLFPIFVILLSWLLGRIRLRPQKPNPAKSSTYECGMQTVGSSWVQFNFRYYLFALIFVVFDIITVFLYPWAVNLKELHSSGLIVLLIFIFILIIGFIHAWRKEALEWK